MNARSAFGALAIVLGLIGTLIAVALGVGVWMAAGRVTGAVDRVASSADRGVVKASGLLDRVEGRITAIDARIRDATDRIPPPGEGQGKARPAEDLAAGLARASALEAASRELEAWASQAEQASDRLEEASASLGDLPFSAETVGKPIIGLADRLDALSGGLMEAVGDLDALHAALETIARATDIPEEARRSAEKLSATASDRLTAVSRRVEAARGRFDEVQSGIGNLRRRAFAWVRWTAFLLTAMLAWLGIGQASLLYLGWTSRGDRVRGGS